MQIVSFGNYSLNRRKGELYRKGQVLDLEPQVYCLLELLISRHGELVSRDDIIASVWDGRGISNNVIDNRIRAARAAIGDTGKKQRYIKTYPNRGYKFIGKVTVVDEDTRPLEKAELTPQIISNTTGKEQKSLSHLLSSPKASWAKIAGIGLLGVFGFYFASQIFVSKISQTPLAIETTDNQAFYKLASSDETNALPRLAILPFEMIGDSSEYGLMPDIFKRQFDHSVTAIEGLTPVSLFRGTNSAATFANFNALRDEFDLDYIITSKLSPYGEDFKLNVSLVRLDDTSTMFSEVYDVKSSNENDLNDTPTDIAVKVTLMTANKLDLSMVNLPTSWKNYDFNLKVEQAVAMQLRGDYQSLKEASQIFREAIQEEPNFLPAYSWLVATLGWMGVYVVEGDEVLKKEQVELAVRMNDIAPNAPETLLINSLMGSLVDGVKKESLGEFDESDPLSVMNYILKKDPDNLQATQMIADMSAFVKPQPETVKSYENVLRLAPTDPWSLMEYSRALFCNGEINRAGAMINRTAQWYPDNRFALLAQLRRFQALGQYEEALITLKRIMDQGILAHEDTVSARNLFFDLGHPELALPHVRFPPARAHAYAMVDNKEAALEAAAIISSFHTSVRSRMIVDEDYFPEDYSAYRTYAKVGYPDGVTEANACRLDFLARDIYVFQKIGSEKFERLLPLLTAYFEGKDPGSLNTQQEYLGLMGLHVIQSDLDKAIEVMDIAMDKGFLFIGSFKDPHLRELTAYPGFAERLARMQKSADALVSQYYHN